MISRGLEQWAQNTMHNVKMFSTPLYWAHWTRPTMTRSPGGRGFPPGCSRQCCSDTRWPSLSRPAPSPCSGQTECFLEKISCELWHRRAWYTIYLWFPLHTLCWWPQVLRIIKTSYSRDQEQKQNLRPSNSPRVETQLLSQVLMLEDEGLKSWQFIWKVLYYDICRLWVLAFGELF